MADISDFPRLSAIAEGYMKGKEDDLPVRMFVGMYEAQDTSKVRGSLFLQAGDEVYNLIELDSDGVRFLISQGLSEANEAMSQYMRYGPDPDNEGRGTLFLGDDSSETTVKVTDRDMVFFVNGIPTTTIDGNGLSASNVMVTSNLYLGGYDFIVRSNDHLALKWIGYSSSTAGDA